MKTHTEGPWRWEINLKSKQMHLAGGRPAHDLYVLGFKRWGMDGARATVREEDGNMVDVDSMASLIPDREHHASWLQTAHHPDLDLIAAAPDLLEALKKVVAIADRDTDEFNAARAAIAKAEGVTTLGGTGTGTGTGETNT